MLFRRKKIAIRNRADLSQRRENLRDEEPAVRCGSRQSNRARNHEAARLRHEIPTHLRRIRHRPSDCIFRLANWRAFSANVT